MVTLRSRDRHLPGGFTFVESLVPKWKPPKGVSFAAVVAAVIDLRQGNKLPKPTDTASVSAEVDLQNALRCQRMGWVEYIIPDGGFTAERRSVSAPKRMPPSNASASVVAGAKVIAKGTITLAKLFGPGQRPVSKEVAEARAAICASCPQNAKGDWTRFFTEPAAAFINRTLSFLKDADLKTSQDEELQICQACSCPLKLKVHQPLDFIVEHTDEKTKVALDERCWIKH